MTDKPRPKPNKDYRVCYLCKRPLMTVDVPKGATRHCDSSKCDYCMACVQKVYQRLRKAGIKH